MELAFGRTLFEHYGVYAADPADIAALLEAHVAAMQERAARLAGRQRDHVPTTADPFTVIVVDEVAFLTAYQVDRKRRERIVAALQDPHKEVLNIRNLFPSTADQGTAARHAARPHRMGLGPGHDGTLGPRQAVILSGEEENKGIRAAAGGPLPVLKPVKSASTRGACAD